MVDGAQIFKIGISNISGDFKFEFLKLVFLISPETSNLVSASTMRSNFDGMQKLGRKGRDPVYATYILNFRTPVNISRMADAV